MVLEVRTCPLCMAEALGREYGQQLSFDGMDHAVYDKPGSDDEGRGTSCPHSGHPR